MIQIKTHLLDAIYRHAIHEYPSECCGIVIGKKDIADHFEMVFPCRNAQDEMHTKAPTDFPRTSKNAYFIDPNDLLRVQKMSRERGMEMKIIYHSHADAGAYFSEEDKKQAIVEGNPVFPGVRYLIIAVTKNQVRGAKLFCWDDVKGDFVEASLTTDH